MLVYGRNVAKEMLKKIEKVEKVYIQEKLNLEKDISLDKINKNRIKYLQKAEMDRLVDGNHQGIILSVTDYKYYNFEDISSKEEVVVILDHIEDPHNFGAIIRTCEAAGVTSVIIPKDRQVQVTGTVVKTSVGTVDNVKIIRVANLVNVINKLKEKGFWIVGTALEDSTDYREIDYSGKIGLVIGNEGSGISRIVKDSCDFVAKIPMYGTTNSLNASVASGIMIYEVIRNRK